MPFSIIALSIFCSVEGTRLFKCCAECRDAECRDAECHYAECRDAECRYAECRYAECPDYLNVMLSIRHEQDPTFLEICSVRVSFHSTLP